MQALFLMPSRLEYPHVDKIQRHMNENGKIREDEVHLLRMSSYHNWNMGHNPIGTSQTIQLPYASQCPYLEPERNILSVE